MPALAPSPHVRTMQLIAAAPLLTHPCLLIRSAPAQQTSGCTDVSVPACPSQARTHTWRSRAAHDAVAEPTTQLQPVPAALRLRPLRVPAPSQGDHGGMHRRDRHPSVCSHITGMPLCAHHASVRCRTGGERLLGTTFPGMRW